MSVTYSLLHTIAAFASAISFAQVVRGLFSLSMLAGFVMFFRPLLVGIVRALVLVVRPRMTSQQLARRNLAEVASRG